MYKKLVSALYVFNIVAQAIVTLLIPVALMFLFAWLLVDKCALPTWIYAVFIPLGVISGFISMIRFAIHAAEGLKRLEKERYSTKSSNNTENKE